MKIATYNVNSIRKRLPIVLDWLDQHQPDVLCLQETKVEDQAFPLLELHAAGYHVTFRGRKAYNGVATLTRREPDSVLHGLEEGPDIEDDRILQTVVARVPIINTYVPQGYKIGTDKYAFKLAWFERLRRYFETRLDPAQPAIWLGDLNVAPEPIDVYHPDRRINDTDFHIDARNAYKHAAAWGFTDVFRALHPDRVQYTYWDYFRNAFARNAGLRIDHLLLSPSVTARLVRAGVDHDVRGWERASDHAPTWVEIAGG